MSNPAPVPDPEPVPGPPEPGRGRFTVVCEACAVTVYVSDTVAHPDPRARLAEFSESGRCPRGGGAACPHSVVSRAERDERRPEWLRERWRELRDRLTALDARLDGIERRRVRGRSLTLPALTAGVPLEVVIVWPSALPDATYQVLIGVEAAPAVSPGTVRAQVRAGSRTATGCALMVDALADVPDGRAGLHVVAQP